MAKQSIVNPSTLRQLLKYDPETGKLYWRERSLDWFATSKMDIAVRQMRWNNRYAGKQAFTAIDAHGYHVGRVFSQGFKAHRVAWAIHHGDWPDQDIDHINGNRWDNRLCNLRDVSRAHNLANSTRKAGATSAYRGVRNSFGKWEARISDGNNGISLGRFNCETAAALAYDTKARQLWGDCATVNFPRGAS